MFITLNKLYKQKKEKASSRDLNALTYSIKLPLFVIMLQIYARFLHLQQYGVILSKETQKIRGLLMLQLLS